MRRTQALAGGHAYRAYRISKASTPIACIALVTVVGVAFWAGAVWIGERLLQVAAAGM
jgi:hypothetical protein